MRYLGFCIDLEATWQIIIVAIVVKHVLEVMRRVLIVSAQGVEIGMWSVGY